jgi:hypothetical protein
MIRRRSEVEFRERSDSEWRGLREYREVGRIKITSK